MRLDTTQQRGAALTEKEVHMACFTLTPSQRALLGACISIGLEGVEGEDDSYSQADIDAIAALIEEIDAGEAPIEITVMRIEDEISEELQSCLDSLGAKADPAYFIHPETGMPTYHEAPEADRDRWN